MLKSEIEQHKKKQENEVKEIIQIFDKEIKSDNYRNIGEINNH